jgi:hypothetical protein
LSAPGKHSLVIVERAFAGPVHVFAGEVGMVAASDARRRCACLCFRPTVREA